MEELDIDGVNSFRRSGVIKNEFIQNHSEQFGQCPLAVALGELLHAMLWSSQPQSKGAVQEAALFSSVSRCLVVLGEFTSDLEDFALLSFVGCIGTFLVSVVSREQDCHQVCYVCLGQPPQYSSR